MDDLTVWRQRKCAQSFEGHRWTYPENGVSTCEKCSMMIRRQEKRPADDELD